MKRETLKVIVACAACSAISMVTNSFAQSSYSTGDTNSSSQSQIYSTPSSSNSVNESSSTTTTSGESQGLSATGRSQGQAIRATQLIGAQVSDSSNQQVGRIADVIVNPTSGKVDFAILALQSSGSTTQGATSSLNSNQSQNENGTAEESTEQNSQSGESNMGGSSEMNNSQMGSSRSRRHLFGSSKLVAVPWSLLQSSSGSSGQQTYQSSFRQESFTVNTTLAKLEQAPSLTRGSWSQISEPSWQQQVNSYFGVSSTGSSSESMGGATSPSGSSTGTSNGIGSESSTNSLNSNSSSSTNGSSGSLENR